MTEDRNEMLVAIPFIVIAVVDASSEELWQAVRESDGSRTFSDVVRSEIESNLESVSYVRHVSIT